LSWAGGADVLHSSGFEGEDDGENFVSEEFSFLRA
jgi:hypothetical protein